jgi:hypothetical protein
MKEKADVRRMELKGLHLHVGYHAEEIGQIAHEILVNIAKHFIIYGVLRCCKQERAPCDDGRRIGEREGRLAP